MDLTTGRDSRGCCGYHVQCVADGQSTECSVAVQDVRETTTGTVAVQVLPLMLVQVLVLIRQLIANAHPVGRKVFAIY